MIRERELFSQNGCLELIIIIGGGYAVVAIVASNTQKVKALLIYKPTPKRSTRANRLIINKLSLKHCLHDQEHLEEAQQSGGTERYTGTESLPLLQYPNCRIGPSEAK